MKRVIKNLIIILLWVLSGLVVFDMVHIYTAHRLEIKEYKPIEIRYQFNKDFTKEEVRKSVVGLFDTPHFYFEKDIEADGMALLLVGTIIINPEVSKEMYGYVLAHELTHLKYRVGNESWVSFKAFTTLYESGDEILQNSALYYADKVMSGWFGEDYDIGYYILEYLEAHNAL